MAELAYFCGMDWKLVLESLRNDIAQVGETLKMLTEEILAEEISEYPIFIATHGAVQLGKPIPEIDHLPLNWFFSVSVLEEFVKKGLIQADRVPNFQRTYSNPYRKACVFVIEGENARFVFVPYEIE